MGDDGCSRPGSIFYRAWKMNIVQLRRQSYESKTYHPAAPGLPGVERGGIGLRVSGLVPERFIAVFYTGLGASLLLAGLLFGGHFGKSMLAKSRLQRDKNSM